MKKLALILGLLLTLYCLKANTIYVSNTLDSGSGSLRLAILNAQNGDTIRFNANLIANGSDSIVLLTEILFSKKLVIKGLYNATDTLKISGGSLTRIFRVTNTDRLYVDSLTLVNAGGTGHGGAIRCEEVDSILIKNSFFIHNKSLTGGGGGIYSKTYNSASTTTNNVLIIDNTHFLNNSSSTPGIGDGGAIYTYSTKSNTHLTITNSYLNNNATSSNGGAIALHDYNAYTYFTLINSEVNNNTSSNHGGGIYLTSPNVAAISASISYSKINNNSALGNGGGIFLSSYSTTALTANYVSMSENSAMNGGAIYNYAFSTGSTTPLASLVMNYSTLSNNTASQNGGGIHSESNSTASTTQSNLTISQTTFTDNSALENGGAIYSKSNVANSSAYSTINITNASIFNNLAVSGGGIYSRSYGIVNSVSHLNLKGSILAFNGTSNIYKYPLPAINSLGYNVFDNQMISGSVNSDSLGVSLVELNLGSLQDNGGSCHTLVPFPYSVAINTGDPSDLTNAQNIPISGIRDRGAAEYSCNTNSEQSLIACGSFIGASGHVYTTSGTYNDTIPNATFCDSIITYNLVIHSAVYDSIQASICVGDTFYLNNQTYFQEGLYFDTIQSSLACDSVIYVLDLSVFYPSTSNVDTTVCTYYLSPGGMIWTSSGSYTDVITNSYGCDSVIQINLNVADIDSTVSQNGAELIANQEGVAYQWINCTNMTPIQGATNQMFTASLNGDYAVVIINSFGCSDTSACFTVDEIGIEGEFGSKFSVYPNPTHGHLVIDLGEKFELITCRLQDMSGKEIWVKEFQEIQLVAFEVDFPADHYLLIIESENQRIVRPIIIE